MGYRWSGGGFGWWCERPLSVSVVRVRERKPVAHGAGCMMLTRRGSKYIAPEGRQGIGRDVIPLEYRGRV